MRIIIDTRPVSGTASRRVSKEYVRQRQRENMELVAREERIRAEYRAKREKEQEEKDSEAQ
jgi:hypothetical protein